MATSGKEWREAREVGIEFTFPISGFTASIRPVEVDLFVMSHEIPDSIAGYIADIINAKPVKLEIPAQEQIEQSKKFLSFLNTLTRFAFVNPKVVDNPQDDNEISIEDVGYSDKLQLFFLFSRPARILRGFRQLQDKHVEAVVPPTNDGDKAEQVGGDQPVGKADNRNARHVDRVAVR